MRETRRSTPLGFQPPAIGDEEIAAVAETLRSGWLTTGPKTAELEQRLADFRLKFLDLLTERRLRNPHTLCRAREAPFVRDSGEEEEVIRFEIHRGLEAGHCCFGGTMIPVSRASESSQQQLH